MELNKETIEQLSELAKKSQLFDLLIAVEYSKLFNSEKSAIRINELIPNYKRVVKFFDANKLSYESYSAASPPSRFDMHFGKEIDFQDLFIVTTILKIFGLQSIFYSENPKGEILIGSHITQATDGSQKRVDEGMLAEELLMIPFHTELNEFLETYLKINVEDEELEYVDEEGYEEEYEEEYDHYDDYDDYGSSYEKYGGYNGYSDDVIDDAFEGDPMNTWNVD